MKNPYVILGIILAIVGAVLTPVFYFILSSIPLTAFGLSTIILGLTCIALANARPYISPEASQTLLRTGMENTSALLEELGIQNRAVYLPSNLRNGHPQAIIPLDENADLSQIKDKMPGRLIVRYGPKADDMAIAVTTIGSINLEMLGNKPGPSADEIESSITYITVGVLDIANGVRVNITDSKINVEISGGKMRADNTWYYQSLGSPLASISAAIASEALDKPVRILEEKHQNNKDIISLEVLA